MKNIVLSSFMSEMKFYGLMIYFVDKLSDHEHPVFISFNSSVPKKCPLPMIDHSWI